METGEVERAGATGPAAALRLIRDRNFGPYFVGNAFSASGTWFQNLAASLFVYRHTHSPFLLGVLQFTNFVPVLLLAPWAGSVADRFDRRRIVLLSQLAATSLSAVLAALAFAGLARVWVVMACGLGLGVVSAYSAPASQALISDLVTRADLQSAVALNSMTYNLARAVGPALAALSVRKLGIPASFAINAGSYLVLVAGVLVVRPAPQRRASRAETRLRESLRLVRGQPRLMAFLLIVTAVGFASDPVNTEAPAFAHAFGHPDTDAGYLIGAFGAGAVAAALPAPGGECSPRSCCSGSGSSGSRSPRGSRSRSASSRSQASATSPRTRMRRAGSSSRSPSTSGDGSWRSGVSPSSGCGRSRASPTERSPARSACAPRASWERGPRDPKPGRTK